MKNPKKRFKVKTGNCRICNRIVLDYEEPPEGPEQFSSTIHFDTKQEDCPIGAKPPIRLGLMFNASSKTTRCLNCGHILAWAHDYSHEEGAWFHIETHEISCQFKASLK